MPFEACEEVLTTVSSLALVHYCNNNYSIPTEYAYQTVSVKGYVNRVIIPLAVQYYCSKCPVICAPSLSIPIIFS